MLSYLKINKSLEITRRISPSEEKTINRQLEKLPDVNKNISDIKANLNEPHWINDSVINDENMPLYAMLAHQNNQIAKESLVTLLLYWAVRQFHNNKLTNIETHFLFDKEKGEVSRQILRECVLYRPRDVRHKAFYFTEQMFQKFMEELKKLPLSEQRFFLVPFTEDSIAAILESRFAGFRVFGTFDKQYMVTSLGIMQTYLNIQYGSHAITMNPVIGYSSIGDIRENGLTDQRDLALHFPYVFLPLKADGHSAPWYIFSKHDFYHAAIISNILPIHRYLFIKLSDAIKKDFDNLELTVTLLEKTLPSQIFSELPIFEVIKDFLKNDEESRLKEFFSNFLIDMEGYTYVIRDYESLEDKFWGFLEGAIYLYKFEHDVPGSLNLYKEVFFDIFTVLQNEKHSELLLTVLNSNFKNIRKTLGDRGVFKHLDLIKEIWDLYKTQLALQAHPQHPEQSGKMVLSHPLDESEKNRFYSPKAGNSQIDFPQDAQYVPRLAYR